MVGPRPVACLLALVVTAGCLGGVGGDGGTTRDPYGVPPGGTDSPGEADATGGTPTPTTTYPPTPASYAFRHVAADHTERLRAAGNFTLRVTYATEGPNASSRSFVARVDLSADRYRLERGLYQNGTGVYRLRAGNGTLERVTVDPTPRELVLDALVVVENRSVRFPLERAGTTTVDGESASRYVADHPGRYRGADGRVVAVTGFSATAAFDDRTVVRVFEYVLRGVLATDRRYAEHFEARITRVGNTTVRPPGTAVNATGE